MIVALWFAVEQSYFLHLQYETGVNKEPLSSHLLWLEEAVSIDVTKTYPIKIPKTLLRLTTLGRKAFG